MSEDLNNSKNLKESVLEIVRTSLENCIGLSIDIQPGQYDESFNFIKQTVVVTIHTSRRFKKDGDEE